MKARLTATQATLEDRKSLMELTLENGRVVYSSYAPEGNEVGLNRVIKELSIEEIFYDRSVFLWTFICQLDCETKGE